MIGVLGGMGPLATVDFFSKVIAAAPATCDADHVPLLIQSDPRIPPRPAAILKGARSPLDALLAGRDRLIAAGAVAVAMPCNTAHFWYADLAQGCSVPFLSIVDACCNELGALAAPGAQVGIIATRATLAARIFDEPLFKLGYIPLVPDELEMDGLVLPAIERVKAGRAKEGGHLIEHAVKNLLSRGASAVILACTETPVALDAIQSELRSRCIDSTGALARSCVIWWRKHASTTIVDELL
jgi:aspartate racemase